MALNWAMLREDRTPVLLPQEKMFIHQGGVRLTLDCTGRGYPGNSGGVYCSSNGTVFLSNRRIVYICANPQPHFQSLSVPLRHLSQAKLNQPWLGPNNVTAVVQPVREGGLELPGVLKLVFNESGAFDFYCVFRELLERLAENESEAPPDHFEPLPVYTASMGSSSTNISHTPPVSSSSHFPEPSAPLAESPEPVPMIREDELPPSYDEIVKHR
ncbi:uncharacterized protein VTP21DRAFT_3989 [Calcarisporiella thermophila]|uniref:uncharacterized protein n=1 Tax=Calcarisporiella thermophila TaxID=911321 RepID=UPI003742D523